jgi:hypothetical protein
MGNKSPKFNFIHNFSQTLPYDLKGVSQMCGQKSGSVVVEALCYKLEGRGFEAR